MVQSPANPKVTHHARSVSLPSRPHPLTANVEDHLLRLKASIEAGSSSPASTICHSLCALRDLYESVNDFLQLPLAQQALSQGNEEALEGSLRLLDDCGTSRDILVLIKESVQELLSSLRRRRAGESSPASEVAGYINSRKKINKLPAT